MPYSPQTWVDGDATKPLSAARLTVIENGISGGTTTADSAVAKSAVTTKGDLLVGTGSGALARVGVGANLMGLVADSTQTTGVRWVKRPPLILPYSQEGTLLAANGTLRAPLPTGSVWAWEATEVAVGTAPSGSPLIVDILYGTTGSPATIYTTTANRPTIAPGAFSAQGGTPNTVTFTGGYFTINITQIGSSVAGADLTVYLYLQRTG